MKKIDELQKTLNAIQYLADEGMIFRSNDPKIVENIVKQLESFITDLKWFNQIK